MFIEALVTRAKIWKQRKCPSTDDWTKKMWDVYAMKYQPLKNETLQRVTTCMLLEGIMLNEISQSEKDKYHVISFICGI